MKFNFKFLLGMFFFINKINYLNSMQNLKNLKNLKNLNNNLSFKEMKKDYLKGNKDYLKGNKDYCKDDKYINKKIKKNKKHEFNKDYSNNLNYKKNIKNSLNEAREKIFDEATKQSIFDFFFKFLEMKEQGVLFKKDQKEIYSDICQIIKIDSYYGNEKQFKAEVNNIFLKDDKYLSLINRIYIVFYNNASIENPERKGRELINYNDI